MIEPDEDMVPRIVQILPAEFLGKAQVEDGILDVGGVKVPITPWGDGTVDVYVRRVSSDLSVTEVHIAKHDGLFQEELDTENAEAERYPLGKKEYWRSKMVGKYFYGSDQHPMTNEEFENDWSDGNEDED